MESLGVILMAAGLGKRMKSDLPKVLHPLGGVPLISYPLRVCRSLDPAKVVVVVGHGAEQVKEACDYENIIWIPQKEQLGTGHAVKCTRGTLGQFPGDLLILSGDVPFITKDSLATLLLHHRDHESTVSLMTACLDHPSGYGRVLRGSNGEVTRIVEDKDAIAGEKQINEVNAGIYVVSPKFLYSALDDLTNLNRQREYYLPDIVSIACRNGERVSAVRMDDPREMLGINTREELAIMERAMQEKINRRLMESGVTLKDPLTTYIDEGVKIGKDTVIGPNTHLMGRTVVGERCLIDGNAHVTNSRFGKESHLKFSVVIADSEIGEKAEIGPFSHLRPGTVLMNNVRVGNFVEVKNSSIGNGTKASHLTYIGDSKLGEETNIGAGTITCNYDGFEKHKTTIGDRVQIGSNTQLVAPVAVEDDAYVGAGSTITENVPAGALAISRVAQKHVKGWVQRFRDKHKKK